MINGIIKIFWKTKMIDLIEYWNSTNHLLIINVAAFACLKKR
jgi:hypothetical protein